MARIICPSALQCRFYREYQILITLATTGISLTQLCKIEVISRDDKTTQYENAYTCMALSLLRDRLMNPELERAIGDGDVPLCAEIIKLNSLKRIEDMLGR